MNYDAILVVSFGGPESPEDVIPFLENVLRGRNVPRERLLAVAEHYYHFGGKSPINQQTRELIAALEEGTGAAWTEVAGLLGKSQLASAAGGNLAADEAGRRSARACVRDFGVQFLLRMPAVSRKHCARTERSWRGRAGDRQAARILQSSRIY